MYECDYSIFVFAYLDNCVTYEDLKRFEKEKLYYISSLFKINSKSLNFAIDTSFKLVEEQYYAKVNNFIDYLKENLCAKQQFKSIDEKLLKIFSIYKDITFVNYSSKKDLVAILMQLNFFRKKHNTFNKQLFPNDNSVTQCVPQTISFLKILSYALFPYPTAWIDGHINILQLILFNATGIPYVYLLTSITEVNKFVFTGFVRQFLLLVLGFLSARKFIENAKDFFKTSLHSVLTRRQQESLDNTERFWTSYLQGFIEEVLNLRPIRTGVLKVVRTITTNSKLNQLLLCYKRDFKNKLSEIANRIAWERDNTSDLTLSEYPLNIYDSPTTLKSEKCIMCLENGPYSKENRKYNLREEIDVLTNKWDLCDFNIYKKDHPFKDYTHTFKNNQNHKTQFKDINNILLSDLFGYILLASGLSFKRMCCICDFDDCRLDEKERNGNIKVNNCLRFKYSELVYYFFHIEERIAETLILMFVSNRDNNLLYLRDKFKYYNILENIITQLINTGSNDKNDKKKFNIYVTRKQAKYIFINYKNLFKEKFKTFD
ncbi:hypothetical protein ABK040_003723 [Willaertia magna]